jgi:hypothetical protein
MSGRLTAAEKANIRWSGQWHGASGTVLETILHNIVPPSREPRGLFSIYERATPDELRRALHLEDVYWRCQRLRRARKRRIARDGAYRQEFV